MVQWDFYIIALGTNDRFLINLHFATTPAASEETKALLVERQREYKVAALRAKKQGDVEQARLYLKISKVCY